MLLSAPSFLPFIPISIYLDLHLHIYRGRQKYVYSCSCGEGHAGHDYYNSFVSSVFHIFTTVYILAHPFICIIYICTVPPIGSVFLENPNQYTIPGNWDYTLSLYIINAFLVYIPPLLCTTDTHWYMEHCTLKIASGQMNTEQALKYMLITNLLLWLKFNNADLKRLIVMTIITLPFPEGN